MLNQPLPIALPSGHTAYQTLPDFPSATIPLETCLQVFELVEGQPRTIRAFGPGFIRTATDHPLCLYLKGNIRQTFQFSTYRVPRPEGLPPLYLFIFHFRDYSNDWRGGHIYMLGPKVPIMIYQLDHVGDIYGIPDIELGASVWYDESVIAT
jgi:hypothetical protein